MSGPTPETQPSPAPDGWIYDDAPQQSLRVRALRLARIGASGLVLSTAGASYQATGDFTFFADSSIATAASLLQECDDPDVSDIDQQIRQFQRTDSYTDPGTDLFDNLEDYGNFMVGQFQEKTGLTFYDATTTIEALDEASTIGEVMEITDGFTQQYGVRLLSEEEVRSASGESAVGFSLRFGPQPIGFEAPSDTEAEDEDIRFTAMQVVYSLSRMPQEIIQYSQLQRLALVSNIHMEEQELSGVWVRAPYGDALMVLTVDSPFFADFAFNHELFHGIDIKDCGSLSIASDSVFSQAASDRYYWIGDAVYPTDYAETGGTGEYKAELFADIFDGNLFMDPDSADYQSPLAIRQRLILARLENIAPGITQHALALQAWHD